MSRTLLVIDDNPLVREVVRRMLEARGFATIVAPDGPEALELTANVSIDAAIVDVDMPRMNGVEVCRALLERAAEARRKPPCVWLMTGVTRADLAIRAAAAGARGVLLKPFTIGELMRCVEGEFGHEAAA